MANALICGLFNDDNDAGQALSNLSEADFDPAGISVVTKDPVRTSALVDKPGPLAARDANQLMAALQRRGVPAAACTVYRDAVAAGAAFVAVAAPAASAAAAAEILSDQHGRQVQILPIARRRS